MFQKYPLYQFTEILVHRIEKLKSLKKMIFSIVDMKSFYLF